MNQERFEQIVREGIKAIPKEFLEKLNNVDIVIENEPSIFQLKELKEILFPINKDKKGVIISIINKWQPTFGFIIIEKSSDAAVKMHSKIRSIWKDKN